MSKYLVDTEIKLGQCNRCQAYVFMAYSSGARSAADPAPVDRGAYILALTEGRRLFRLTERAGRPHRLLTVAPERLRPSFDARGAQTGAQRLLAEHGCGGHQRNMITFTELEAPEPKTVCETWREQGWTPPPRRCARDRGQAVASCSECEKPPFDTSGGTKNGSEASQEAWDAICGSVPAEGVELAPEGPQASPGGKPEPSPRCDRCGGSVRPGEFWGIQYGDEWVHAEHVECP